MIVLDTHALIWLAEGHAALGRQTRSLVDQALRRDRLSVSAISFWETAMLRAATLVTGDKQILRWSGSLGRQDARL